MAYRLALNQKFEVRILDPEHFWVSGKAREFQRAVNPSPMAE